MTGPEGKGCMKVDFRFKKSIVHKIHSNGRNRKKVFG
jgi:hypothetical protein